jgi:hypothetical protein
VDSKRTKAFKKFFDSLPDHIKENALKQYKLFLENQSHPSLRTKLIGSTRNKKLKVYEVTVGMGYRATYFRDGDVNVWFWIRNHNSFDRRY